MNKKDSPIPSSIYIGTCGWSYKEDWKTVFYPDWLPESQFLEYYSNIFSTNEIDSSLLNSFPKNSRKLGQKNASRFSL